MSFDSALLDILCCPVTRLPLERMPVSRLERLNALVGERKIKNRGGATVEQALEEALVTRDGKLAYPVRDGIPVLLEDEGIELSQVGA
ncbi:MAG TPA: Trm112 family protein [Gammaproteobacteria bacterium]|nr:Trm112 family protein [Gammaproteobacteria bacterium]